MILSNIDYSFRDEKYEYNIPIKERQILLFKFSIVELIDKSLDFYLKQIKKDKENFLNEKTNKMLNELLINIIKFFKNLSADNEIIKQTIYIISLNKLIKLSDEIFSNNTTGISILINFIFNLIDDSEALQDYLLGGGNILKSQVSSNENLKNHKLDNLLRKKKLLGYIEKNHNYLLYYEKLIGLNKVQYKRKEIESQIKSHIESVNEDSNKGVRTYKIKINKIIDDLKQLIRKHAILLNKFMNMEKNKSKSASTKKRSLKKLFRKNTLEMKKEEEQLQEMEEKEKKEKMRRSVTNARKKISIEETQREDTTNKFLESEEKEFISDTNNKIHLFNNNDTIKDEKDASKKKDKKIIKDDQFNLKRTVTATTGFNFFKRKKADFSGKESINKFGNISYFNKIQSEFSKGKLKSSLSRNNFSGNAFSSLKSVDVNMYMFKKAKTKSSTNLGRRTSSIKPQITLNYNDYLKKLGKIYTFIQFFTSLDLDKSLFINEHFLNLIEKEKESGHDGNLDPSLFIFFTGGKIKEGKNCFLDKNIANLYLFHLYNMFFPNIKSNLGEKIQSGETINGNDIFEEIKDINIEQKNYSEVDDESKYSKEAIKEFNIIDDNLCILYSIFQCLINQFTQTIFDLFKLKCNFYLNFLSIGDIIKSKEYFSVIIKNLLSQVVFLNNDYLENIYKIINLNSSLLNQDFDFDEQIVQNKKLYDKTLWQNNTVNFSNREVMLIEYIFYFSKNYDKIKYLYEKMILHKYIKNLVDYEKSKPSNLEIEKKIEEEQLKLEDKKKGDKDKSKLKNNLEEKTINDIGKEKEILIKERLKSLSSYLNNQKLKILKTYEKLLESNKKYSLSNNSNNEKEFGINDDDRNIEGNEKDKSVILKIKEKSEFITQLLKNYEIKNFFNNIIFLETKKDKFMSDKSLKKLRRVREYLDEIDNEILKLKLNFYMEEKDKDENNRTSLKVINRNLGKIYNEEGTLFKLGDIKKGKENSELTKMLINENKSFFKKIKFTKIFERMAENIKNFVDFRDKNILICCSYLLKIFIDMKDNDNNFLKNSEKNYKLYENLLSNSLKCINNYAIDEINDEEPIFLNISYLVIEAFLTILKNIKLNFVQMKNFMEKIFSGLGEVFNKFENRKYKIVYQILYTYAVSRVLIILNKQRLFDSYAYDIFFKKIYPTRIMKNNISICFQAINNSLNKEHILSRRSSAMFIDSNSMNEESEESFSKFMPDEERENLIADDSKDKISPMDLSFVNKKKEVENLVIKKKQSSSKKIQEKDKTSFDDYIWWEDQNELDKFSFYLNYLSIYVIYLNYKNTLMEENKDEFPKKKIEKEETGFSFNVLSEKIKSLMDIKDNDENQDQKNKDKTEYSIEKEKKIFYGEYLGPQNLDYKFFSVLLESILVYRAKLNGQNIEIQIKKTKEKKEEEKLIYEENSPLKSTENLYINKNDNDNIIFYYYNPESIDIILLEKILNEIELKECLANYCLEDSQSDNSKMLNELFKDKKAYRLIQSYYDEEYNLIHNYFIKNNMELLIKRTLTSFEKDINKF